MGQIYSTGPVALYAGANPTGTPVFLGHGRQAPVIRRRRFSRPVTSDLSGMAPHDRAYGGEIVTVSVMLQRFANSALANLQDVPGSRTAAPHAGIIETYDIGALMIEEQCAYPLWIVFMYSRKPAFQRAGTGPLHAGYLLHAAVLDDDSDEAGWGPYGVQLNFTGLPHWNPARTGGGGSPAPGAGGNGGFDVYRRLTVADISALPPYT